VGAKGAGQGLRASSISTVPGPPPPSAGAAAGSYRLPTHPFSHFCVSRCPFFSSFSEHLSHHLCPHLSESLTLLF
jgi:hypothetical protein